jgi:Zn-dependent M28 family amino/carboxypeptidase
MATVRHLAADIGPRLASSPAFARAAAWVGRRFEAYGYDVRRQPFPVPAGDSWGVPVEAGTSLNVIASPADFDPSRPWRLVGAHLDTVAVAPGAEDNASGVAVLLELARLAAIRPTALPTVLVAFGGEEPLGAGEALHHFGSHVHAHRLAPAERRTLRAMVALDRVGVGDGGVVPACTGGISPLQARNDLIAVARWLGIETTACTDNSSSDHYSYERIGVTAARLGGTPYAGYHSTADVVSVVEPAQLRRVGRIMWAWLRP